MWSRVDRQSAIGDSTICICTHTVRCTWQWRLYDDANEYGFELVCKYSIDLDLRYIGKWLMMWSNDLSKYDTRSSILYCERWNIRILYRLTFCSHTPHRTIAANANDALNYESHFISTVTILAIKIPIHMQAFSVNSNGEEAEYFCIVALLLQL